MMGQLEKLDQRLLDVLQTEIPLVPRPFAAIGETVGASEDEVLKRVSAMKHPPAPARPIIRQISAIFDSKSLGYASTLVAAQVEEARLDEAAAVINLHPGVSHNYQRNHAFNLWYTLAVPPDSELGLEKTLAILHRQSGAKSTRMLPTLKLFKIGVKFDLSGDADLGARSEEGEGGGWTQAQRDAAAGAVLSDTDKHHIRILQQDLPVVAEPFALWAQQGGVSEAALLEAGRDFLKRGLIRRFSAVLKHREAGISANAMGVWAVPAGQQDAFGKAAASYHAVSHCYLRRSYADWPYTMFTMVHAPTKEQCEQVLATISQETGIREYGALYSTKEYKKVRVKYFTPESAAWERENR
jgi:DNA-binding Lrp family transcriptional regulator